MTADTPFMDSHPSLDEPPVRYEAAMSWLVHLWILFTTTAAIAVVAGFLYRRITA